MKLHGYFRSSAAYRVRIAINLKGLTVEHIPVHLIKDGGQQKSSNYRNLNPQALVPSFALDDGTILTQSLAIIEYIDSIHPLPRLIPADAKEAARVRAVSQIIACEIHPLNNLRVLQYLKGPLALPQDAIDAWMKHWMMDGGLDSIEALLPGSTFCFGDQPTLADCCLIPQLFNARRFKISFDHLPKICRVEQTCATNPHFAAAHPSRQPDAE